MKKSNITKKHIKDLWGYSDLKIVHITTPKYYEETYTTVATIYAVSENDVMYEYVYFKQATDEETIDLYKVL